MSNPPTQASDVTSSSAHEGRHRARKRRKHSHIKDSIYLAPEVGPYPRAIKQQPSPGPSTGYAPLDEDGEIIDDNNDSASTPNHKKKGKRVERAARGDKETDPQYRARALKAWDTKRQRQKERFETLEASTSLLALGWGSTVPIDIGDGMSIYPPAV